MKNIRIALSLCGLSLALAGAGCQTTSKCGDPCARQVGPHCSSTKTSSIGSCLTKDSCCEGKASCSTQGCAPACPQPCATGCCPNGQVCNTPVCSSCGTACGGSCGVVCNESLKSCLGVGIKQQMHVGEIQVDEEKLEQHLAARKRLREEEKRMYQEYCNAQEQHYRMQREKQLRQYIDTLYGGSDCAGVAKPICCLPAPPHCPELPPPPQFTPLRPTEIPMMIPVTLEVGVEKTHVTNPRVERTCLPACPSQPCARPCSTYQPLPTPPAAPTTMPPAPMTRRATPAITPASSSDDYIRQRSAVR